MRRLIRIFLLLAAFAAPAQAQPAEVDLELVLAVDISRSMSHTDLALQRRGYAAALTSDAVLGAIGRGLLGRIALTYVEWSDAQKQRVLVPWTLIATRADAEAFAGKLIAETGGTTRETSISAGLLFAAAQFDAGPFTSYRQVIDISGDGPNNNGPPVSTARDTVVARGITVNGLPLMLGRDPVWTIPELDLYYRDCVTGGPGSFVVPVWSMAAFADAIRRKLVLEIAGTPQTPAIATLLKASSYDCLIGEKIRQRRRGG